MSLNAVAKSKVMAYLNKTPMNSLHYECMLDYLGKNNYKVTDFLKFFITIVKENLKKDKIPLKITKKMVVSITSMIEWDDLEYFDSQILNSINEIYMIYQNYLGKNPDFEDKELTEFIEELLTKASSLRTEDSEDKSTQDSTNDNAINDLLAKLRALENVIAEKDRKISRYNDIIDDLKLKNRAKNFKIAELEETIARLEKELALLSETLKKFQSENTVLAKKYEEANQRLATLKVRTSKIREENSHIIRRDEALRLDLEKTSFENAVLRSQLADIRSLDIHVRATQERNKQIEEIILSYLCRQSYSAQTLIKALLKSGYDITAEELFEHIKRLRKKYHIETSKIELGKPKYKISKPPFLVGEEHAITLPRNASYVDLVFTADYHICDLTTEFLDNYNRLLEYCDRNNIYMIINLGDFYDFNNSMGYKRNIDALRYMEEKHENTIENLPKSPIYQVVLGGNHDESVAYLGEDYLTEFIESRIDFLSLGYRYSELTLEKSSNSNIRLLLAHPFNSISKTQSGVFGLNFANYGFSFLGHSHTNKIYTERKYCKVPSLIIDSRDAAGFLHVRFYFNSKCLEHMKIKPLTLERKIVSGKSIHYPIV